MLCYCGLSVSSSCSVHKQFRLYYGFCALCCHMLSWYTRKQRAQREPGHGGRILFEQSQFTFNSSVEKIQQQNWPPNSVILPSLDLWVARLRGCLGFVTLPSSSSQTLIHWFCCSMWRSKLSRPHTFEFVTIQEIIEDFGLTGESWVLDLFFFGTVWNEPN